MEESVEHFENMCIESMYGSAEWATGADVMGAAAFLKTPISVYMTHWKEWQHFRPAGDLRENTPVSCIYLKLECGHFEPVLSV